MTIQSYKMGPGTLVLNVERTAQVNTVNTSDVITAPEPTFVSGDVGAAIVGTGIPASTTITSVESAFSATLSAAATADGTGVTATITPAGASTDISCQVSAGTVTPSENVETGEEFNALCGEDDAGEETVTYTYQLTATLRQDLTLGGFIDYAWSNKGTVVAFDFTPNTALGRTVSGLVRIAPVVIGGDVKTRPTHDIAWAVPAGFHPNIV